MEIELARLASVLFSQQGITFAVRVINMSSEALLMCSEASMCLWKAFLQSSKIDPKLDHLMKFRREYISSVHLPFQVKLGMNKFILIHIKRKNKISIDI